MAEISSESHFYGNNANMRGGGGVCMGTGGGAWGRGGGGGGGHGDPRPLAHGL